MKSFALIGGDGAGKTTIARKLEQCSQIHAKYMYMGLSTRSSNVSLPTSRLVVFIKRYLYRSRLRKTGKIPSSDIPASDLEYSDEKRSTIWIIARLLNRLAETLYRQTVSIMYQLRGYNIIYDRYYLYDITPNFTNMEEGEKQEWDMSILYWFMNYIFPRPGLVIFLDAPVDILFRRKGEASLELLEKQRESFLDLGKKLKYFVRIDATQSVDVVQEQVFQSILEFLEARRSPSKIHGQ